MTPFAKRTPHARSEAAGLEALRAVPGAPPVPRVLELADDRLVLERVPAGRPTAAAARGLGAGLAALHRTRPACFGRPEPGVIGTLPVAAGTAPDWPSWYATRCRDLAGRAGLSAAQRGVLDAALDGLGALPGADEPPALLHGDLWSGNVLWDDQGETQRAWLVDPSVHAGHRETDLAMLALFGLPHLAEVLAAYDAAHPLAPGWRERVGLHQLEPLLVHAVLFGGSYAEQAVRAVQSGRSGQPGQPGPSGPPAAR